VSGEIGADGDYSGTGSAIPRDAGFFGRDFRFASPIKNHS